jgi:preprotein translocase subunit SecD
VAPPPGTLRVGRYLLALTALLAVLYGVAYLPGQRHTPKLGIDLVGGIRVIFTAQSPKHAPPPTSDQMTQARQILEDRINGSGVTGSTVVVQGSDQLVVEIPNGTGADVAALGKAAVLNFRGLVAPEQPVACVLSNSKQFKKALPPAAATAIPTATPSATSTPSGSTPPSTGTSTPPSASTPPSSRVTPSGGRKSAGQSANAAGQRLLTKPSSSTKAKPSTSSKAKPSTSSTKPKPSTSSTKPAPSGSGTTPTPSPTPTQTKPHRCSKNPLGAVFKADPTLQKVMPNAEECPSPAIPTNSQCKPWTALSTQQKQEVTTALSNFDCPAAQAEPDEATKPSYYIACDTSSHIVYLLGTVVVRGQQIDEANAQAPNISNGQPGWSVSLQLGSSGGDRWFAWTKKYNTAGVDSTDPSLSPATCAPGGSNPCSNYVGFTLDGQVITLPVTQAALNQQTSISGNFNQTSANALSKELNYGKLPLSFRADANEHVSATLGASQLRAAFLAGGIGLILVVLYSLLYYRGLGIITIASLLVSAGLTYAMLIVLGNQIGFTLDLAGIAGFIVALGITADSFVVFFERIKDEVHGGRSVRVAVPRAWVRARRTILSADTVSFLAAAILYFFASADVKGFAFTLGMSTILDLVVVFLFTHPIVSLLSRSRTFGSPRFTGLNSLRLAGGDLPDEPAAPKRARDRGQRRTAAAPTIVLEKETTAEDEAPDNETVEDETAADAASADQAPDEPAAPDAEPRRRSTPAPGSAAERAAARRAKQRRDADGKDKP